MLQDHNAYSCTVCQLYCYQAQLAVLGSAAAPAFPSLCVFPCRCPWHGLNLCALQSSEEKKGYMMCTGDYIVADILRKTACIGCRVNMLCAVLLRCRVHNYILAHALICAGAVLCRVVCSNSACCGVARCNHIPAH
jgi:hypothetical protein